MSGYVETGYIVAIGTLLSYGVSVVVRERGARLRLGVPRAATAARDEVAPTNLDDDRAPRL